MNMDEYRSLRQAGTITDPPPEVFARAQQILLDYIALDTTPVVLRATGRRRLMVVSGFVATAAAVAAVAVLLPGGGGLTSQKVRHAGGVSRPPVHLSAQTVALISSRSAAAVADSGTAVETTTNSVNGSAQGTPETIDVTFSGENVNYLIASNGNGAEGVENRVVNGQFYLYVKGQDLQMHWYHDTSSNAAASESFPDPRTLLQAVSPSTGLENLGQQSVDGTELTHLRATTPGSIGRLGIPDLTDTVTSFDVWVDTDNVVRRMIVSSSPSSAGGTGAVFMCEAAPSASGPSSGSSPPVKIVPSERISTLPNGKPVPAGTVCGTTQTMQMSSTLEIQFANLGAPESVTVPPGAVDQQGLG
jgi:hypothetical protein